jgi:nitroimidazol reductase NimA-like FMN-containing flavoprotein (pyridoxamine 5'-phosphate oxidase superfamily)
MTSTTSPTPDASAPGLVAFTRQPLARAACLALLAPGGHGRIASTMRAVPVIIPVTFSLFGDDIVFSPGLGDGLSRAIANSVVAFGTDHVGSDGRAIWNVHVTGVARPLAHGRQAPGFRLSSEIITGWQAGS